MFSLAAAVVVAAVAAGSSFDAKVIGVVDADTLEVLDEAKVTHRVRLHGIDSPERGQPFAKKARAAMSSLVAGQNVTVESLGDDRYGRLIARIVVDGRDVGQAMIAGGWAWHYVKYDDSEVYAAAERQARESRAGLWRNERAVPPWEWRKMPKADRLPVQKAITADTE
jgi:endonuclease YncB( thermonuclease family)